jgi:predicted ester cyclase
MFCRLFSWKASITGRWDGHRASCFAGKLGHRCRQGYLTLYDDSIKLHGHSPEPMNKAAVVGFYQQIWSAFAAPPPLEFHEVMVDGDMYACRFTMRGTHRGVFMGVPATGRSVVLSGLIMLRFSGGVVVESWSSADMLGLMMQIGAMASPTA